MPCSYDTSFEDSLRAKEERDELNKVTRLLCELMTQIEGFESGEPGDIMEPSPELRVWWGIHKKMDKQRKADKTKTAKFKAEALARAKAEEDKREKKEYERLKKKYSKK